MSLSIGVAGAVATPDYAIIHYVRTDGDYGDHTTGDFNDYWGLHLWGSGIDAGEVTGWTDPKPFLGEDEYGRFAWIKLAPDATEVWFIVHRGDVRDGTSLDRVFNPAVTPEIWIRQDDPVVYESRAEAERFATIHYHRDDGDYGDPTSSDFNDFWGMHLWTGAAVQTPWTDPLRPDSSDLFGITFRVKLSAGATELHYILHRGDTKDPGPDQVLYLGLYGDEVWQLQDADPDRPYILPVVEGQDAVDGLLGERIEQLIADGSLSRGQGNALLNKLGAAIKKLDQGKDEVAINLLQALINQVSDFVDEGILTPAEGQSLIDAANQIIGAIGG
jgi:hypothetical protein